MTILTDKLKEVLMSVLPVTMIVLILHFTLTPFSTPMLIRFLIGIVLIIAGLTFFLIGVDIGVTPIGSYMGRVLAKSNRIWILAITGLILGFFISIAEPALHVLADQVDLVTDGLIDKLSLVATVSIGIGLLLILGLLRIVYNIPLYKILTVLYILIFILVYFASDAFTAIAFDASGATTGAFAVPFIFALSIGISTLKKDSKASEKDSFGLIAIVSAGAIITVLIMSLLFDVGELSGSLDLADNQNEQILAPFLKRLPHLSFESLMSLLPLVILFIAFHFFDGSLPGRQIIRVIKGLGYALIGLILFLLGVNAGLMQIGSFVGYQVAGNYSTLTFIAIAFMMGVVTILTEPAVHVLTRQIEDVTSGAINSGLILGALALGVGMAIALSGLRVLIPAIQLWHYILPGYIIALTLMYFVPKLFVGIAFDSGGVASGPMTGTFILAFIQGSAEVTDGASVLIDGFGMIAMVAMMPIITLQILGLVFKIKSRKGDV